MIYLVVGDDRVDAGKTTFSIGLLERTGAVGYKPRAGNDYWFDHDDCLRALSRGRLYGKDASKLAEAEGRGRRPGSLNPVHRLWQPAPGGATGLLGRADREFVIDRIGTEQPSFVVNGTADVPDRVADRLPLEAATIVETIEELNDLTETTYLPAFEALAEEIEATDLAVVESYGDVARPLRSLDPAGIAAVAVVEPRRVRIYRGDRYCRACEVARSSPHDGTLEKRVGNVIDPLDPVARASLPALSSDDRTDPARVARAYEPAYEALLEAGRS